MSIIKALADGILSAVYPDNVRCIICNEEAVTDKFGICESCAAGMCDAAALYSVMNDAEYLDDITASLSYNTTVGAAIKRMKYSQHTYLAKKLSVFLEAKDEWQYDFVTAVPMHRHSAVKRGYNQAVLLAKEFSKRNNAVFIPNAVKRIMKPTRQALLSRADRLLAQKNTMTADRTLCDGRSILVIDDVCTTGSTLNECARAMKQAGAKAVYACVIAHG